MPLRCMLDAPNKATWYRSGQAVFIADTGPNHPQSTASPPKDRPALTASVDASQG